MADLELSLCLRPYRETYSDQVEQAMGEGYTLTAFAGLIGVSRQVVDGWIADQPVFAEAVGRGLARRSMHWERAALEVVDRGGAGAASVILFGLKTLGAPDWAEGSETGAAADARASVVVFALPENGRASD
jgi:hypothetical protein